MSTFTIMWQMYEIVIINELYAAFPGHTGIITGILSLPCLVTAFSSLVAGWLLSKFSTKMELVLAAVLMCAGVAPLFSANIYALLIASILMAVAAGISNTAGMAIIAEVFIEEKLRSRMMGWYNAAMSILSCVITMIGGLLAVRGWQNGFQLYWFSLPMLLLCIGIASTVSTAGSFLIGILFGFLFTRLHRRLNLYCYLCPILIYVMLYFAPNQITILLACLLYGICYGGVFTFIYVYPECCIPPEKQGFVMGLMTVNYSAGDFLGINLTSWLMGFRGGSITAVYPFAIVLLLAASALEFVCCLKDRKELIC